MRRCNRRGWIVGLGVLVSFAQTVFACSPTSPPPTLRDQYARYERVYMARLVSLKRTPAKGSEEHFPELATEDATFSVLMTLKGSAPKSGTITTHTEVLAGNCSLSVVNPVTVIGKDGKPVQNALSDVWVLIVSGKEPYQLHSLSFTMPINLFSEPDLRFLLQGSQRRSP
jgi:hypothetical protein